jgi:hypothetical protein
MLVCFAVILSVLAGVALLSPQTIREIALRRIEGKEGPVYQAHRQFINSRSFPWHIRGVGVGAALMLAIVIAVALRSR